MVERCDRLRYQGNCSQVGDGAGADTLEEVLQQLVVAGVKSQHRVDEHTRYQGEQQAGVEHSCRRERAVGTALVGGANVLKVEVKLTAADPLR